MLWYHFGTPPYGMTHLMWTAKHTSLIGNFSSYMLYFLSVRIRGYSGCNISWGSLLPSLSLQIKTSCFHVLCVQEAAPRLHSPEESPAFSSLNCEATPCRFGILAFSFFRSRAASSALRCSSNLASSSWSESKRKLEKLENFFLSDNVNKTAAVHTLVFSSSFGTVSWERHVAEQLSFLHSQQSTLTRLHCKGSLCWFLVFCFLLLWLGCLSFLLLLLLLDSDSLLTNQPSPSASSWFQFNLNRLYKCIYIYTVQT